MTCPGVNADFTLLGEKTFLYIWATLKNSTVTEHQIGIHVLIDSGFFLLPSLAILPLVIIYGALSIQ